MISDILFGVFYFVTPPASTYVFRRYKGLPMKPGHLFYSHWAQGAMVGIAVSLGALYWLAATAYSASSLLAFVLLWLSRRKRKRVFRKLGGKALARLVVMLRRMPKPAPRLAPQGA
jgi:hypothetical protein